MEFRKKMMKKELFRQTSDDGGSANIETPPLSNV